MVLWTELRFDNMTYCQNPCYVASHVLFKPTSLRRHSWILRIRSSKASRFLKFSQISFTVLSAPRPMYKSQWLYSELVSTTPNMGSFRTHSVQILTFGLGVGDNSESDLCGLAIPFIFSWISWSQRPHTRSSKGPISKRQSRRHAYSPYSCKTRFYSVIWYSSERINMNATCQEYSRKSQSASLRLNEKG